MRREDSMISSRQLKKQLQKMKEQIQIDVMDWCSSDFNSNDANFIRCCISDYLPELLLMEDEDIHKWCVENGVHNFNDLASMMCENLEIDKEGEI